MDLFPSSWIAEDSAATTRQPSQLHRRGDEDARTSFSSRRDTRRQSCTPHGRTTAFPAKDASARQRPRSREIPDLKDVGAGSRRRMTAAPAEDNDASSFSSSTTSSSAGGLGVEREGLATKKKKKKKVEEVGQCKDFRRHHRSGEFNEVSAQDGLTEKESLQQKKRPGQLEEPEAEEESEQQEEEEDIETERKKLLAAARDVMAAVGGDGKDTTAVPVFSAEDEEVAELFLESGKRKETRKVKNVIKKQKGGRTDEIEEVPALEAVQKASPNKSSSSSGRAIAENIISVKQQQQKETEEPAVAEEEFDLNIVETAVDTSVDQSSNPSKKPAPDVPVKSAGHHHTRDSTSAAADSRGRCSSTNSRISKYAGERSNFNTRRDNTETVSSMKRTPASSFSSSSSSSSSFSSSAVAAGGHCPPLFLSRRASLTVSDTTSGDAEEEKNQGEHSSAAAVASQANGPTAAANEKSSEGKSRDKKPFLSPQDKQVLQRQIPKMLPFEGAQRRATISVALPASIIDNAQTQELQAALVGQIARTLTVFGVDEIIIYEDVAAAVANSRRADHFSRALAFFVRNLEYLETPQYLRKHLFPLHPDLRYAGLQNPLDAPHHLRRSEWLPYREGYVAISALSLSSMENRRRGIEAKDQQKKKKQQEGSRIEMYQKENEKEKQQEEVDQPSSENRESEQQRLREIGGSWVECGLPSRVWIPQALPCNSRVTVRLDSSARQQLKRQQQRQQQQRQRQYHYEHLGDDDVMKGYAVSPDEPASETGLYWGYRIRAVHHFYEIFRNCPFSVNGEYDLTIGTSERGTVINSSFSLPSFR